jgi:dimethyl sulfoxide reductase iron-sulfur subunit
MNKRWGIAIDQNRCIGCWTCAAGCKAMNNQPLGVYWNRILTVAPDENDDIKKPASAAIDVPAGEGAELEMAYQATACQHCQNAPCEKVCPVGATFRREDGVVLIDFERCIGCRYCMAACPYGARSFNWQQADYPLDFPTGYGRDYRTADGRLVFTPERPRGTVEKCTMCVERIDAGQKPFCVQVCPTGARIFGDWNDPDSEICQAAKRQGRHELLGELGTKPSVCYLPVNKPNKSTI